MQSISGTIPEVKYNYCSSNKCQFVADGSFHCRRNPVNNNPNILSYNINERCYVLSSSNHYVEVTIDSIQVNGKYNIKDLNGNLHFNVDHKFLKKHENYSDELFIENFTDKNRRPTINPAYSSPKQFGYSSNNETNSNYPFSNKSSCSTLPNVTCSGQVVPGQHLTDMNCKLTPDNVNIKDSCAYNKNCAFNWPSGFTGLNHKQTDKNSCRILTNDGSAIINPPIVAHRRPDGSIDECCGCNSCGCSANCSNGCCNSGLIGNTPI